MLRELSMDEVGFVSGGTGRGGSPSQSSDGGIGIDVTAEVGSIISDIWSYCIRDACREDVINRTADELSDNHAWRYDEMEEWGNGTYRIGDSNTYVRDSDGNGEWDQMFVWSGDVWRYIDSDNLDWRNGNAPWMMAVLPDNSMFGTAATIGGD
jgi:hypothetical protein